MKRCTKCGIVKPLNEFHRRSLSPDGYVTRCRACIRDYQAAYRQENRGKIRQEACA